MFLALGVKDTYTLTERGLMSETNQVPFKKIIWRNIIFFVVTTFLGIVGGAIYLFTHGLSISELLLFAFFTLATPLSITMGYHRLFAHMSYKANPIVQFLFLFFGAAAFQQSALKWASQHRVHHQFVDTERDPYSIKKGFFYAHIGWLMFWYHPVDYKNVGDLKRNFLIRNQHEYYPLWAIGAGILTPLLIGALTGHLLGALLFAVCARITLVYHGTFCINSVCHMFGKATYDIYSTAKDHWLAALITFGEGDHNYHHNFPIDYRNGVRWYHWDPTKWLITILAWMGLATDLKTISKYKILAARLRAKHQSVEDVLKGIEEHPKLELLREKVKAHYEHLKNTLAEWEHHAVEYQSAIRGKMESSKEKVYETRRRFKQGLKEWQALSSQILQFAKA